MYKEQQDPPFLFSNTCKQVTSPFPFSPLGHTHTHTHTLKRQNGTRKSRKNRTREAVDLAHQTYCRAGEMRTENRDQISLHIES